MKKVLVLFACLLCSCEASYSDIKPDLFEIFAPLEAGKPGQVQVSRIYRIGQVIDSTTISVDNAKFALFENGTFFDSLNLKSHGYYQGTKLIQEGSTYRLQGTIASNISIKSSDIIVPKLDVAWEIEYKPDTVNFKNSGVPSGFLNLRFDLAKSGYFIFDVSPETQDSEVFTSVFFFSENVQKEIDDCTSGAVSNIANQVDYSGALIFDMACLSVSEIAFLVERSAFVKSPSSGNFELKEFNKLSLLTGVVSESFFIWNRKKGLQPTGRERFSVDPVRSYTNIEGAQGVVFGLNLSTQILE